MSVEIINPESAVLGQVQEYWQQIATMLVWKLAKGGVKLTAADLREYQAEFECGEAILLTHGHVDSIEFKIVTRAEAETLAAHDRVMRGHA